jgi:hypothetical protein
MCFAQQNRKEAILAMKRGLISWDKELLPPAVFEERLAAIDRRMAEFDVPALVAYSDVWRSNDVRFISNYMPYWNRAFTVVPRGEKPILLCALSPRVYPWIKSVTIHEVIVASPNLPKQLAKLCAERGWAKVGVLDHQGLPNDLYTQLAAEDLRIVDMPRSVLRAVTTDAEVRMHREAAKSARRILEQTLEGETPGATDHQLAGRLERKFRRAGAEDLVILTSDGCMAPLPAAGNIVDKNTSIVVAVEYNGHWVKLSRNLAGVTCPLPPTAASAFSVHRETLSGPYAWGEVTDGDGALHGIVSLQVEMNVGGRRLYYGDTCLQAPERLEIL